MELSTVWIIIFGFFILYLKTKDSVASILFSVLNYINFIFALKISDIILDDMLKIKSLILKEAFLFLFIGIISYTVGKILANSTKKVSGDIKNVFSLRKNIFLSCSNVCMITGGIYISLNLYRNSKGTDGTFLNILFLIIYIIAVFLCYKLFFYNFKKEIEKQNIKNEVSQLEKYSASLEDVLNDMRKFKHDYINILSTFQGFIEEENYKGLKEYFYNDVYEYSEELNSKNIRLSLLGNIKIRPLKGIISSKILKAYAENINVFIDISEVVDNVEMSMIDLCKIVGILMDNAIEASLETLEPKIELGIVAKKDCVIFIIKNNCLDNLPPIYKMFENGFSTKGEDRGIGLFSVREIIDKKYSNTILNTQIDYESKSFIQELRVKFINVK